MISIFDEIEQYFENFPQWKKAFSLAIGQPKTYEEALETYNSMVVMLRDFLAPMSLRITDLYDYVNHLEALQPTFSA